MKHLILRLSVFAKAVRLGFAQSRGDYATALGLFATYACVVGLYGNLFSGIPADTLAARGLSARDMAWYLGGTELVVFGFSNYVARQFQAALRAGQYEGPLLRPCPGWIAVLGEWYGSGLATVALMIAPCLLVTAWLAGGFDGRGLQQFVGYVASLGLAGICLCCMLFLIAASCVWIKQAEPVLWMAYKAMFLFGALLWPLALYPSWFGKLAWLTPFPAFLAAVGNWLLPLPLEEQIAGLMAQLVWVVVFASAVSVMDRQILRRWQSEAA